MLKRRLIDPPSHMWIPIDQYELSDIREEEDRYFRGPKAFFVDADAERENRFTKGMFYNIGYGYSWENKLNPWREIKFTDGEYYFDPTHFMPLPELP